MATPIHSDVNPAVKTSPALSRGYATRKTIAQGALDLALLMANASQLKALVDVPSNHRDSFYIPLLVLLSVSILLQIATGVLLVILGLSEPTKEEDDKKMIRMNNASIALIFIITVINIFVSAFGISYVDQTYNNI